MTTEALNVRTTLREKPIAEEKTAAKPNYVLLVIGLALVLFQMIANGYVQVPVANAALLALGVTLVLYGVYPMSVMKGQFTGLFGVTLALTGPAALGVFLFIYTLNSLNEEAKRRQYIDDFVLLTTSTTDQRHNSRTIDGTTIRLLETGSFAEDNINNVVNDLDSMLVHDVSDKKKRYKEIRRLLASVIPHLRLGQPHEATALAAVDAYLNNQPDSNKAWTTAVAAAAADNPRGDVIKRVKKLPFAVMKVTEKSRQPQFYIVSENSQLPAGSRTYDVPVIANPAKRSMPNLQEAVVLIPAAQ